MDLPAPRELIPATDRAIAGLIARLLLHYRGDNLPPELQQVIAEDWLEDLRQFTPIDVESACREWRRANDRRPTPANIRILAIAAQRERVPALPKPPTPSVVPSPPMSEEDRTYIAEGFTKLKASLGALPPMPIAKDDDVPREQSMSPLTRDLIRQGLGGGN